VDGFHVIACHNPGVHGAVLTEALASRFAVHIEIGTDYDLAADLTVPPDLIAVAKHLNDLLRQGQVEWAPQMRELLAYRDVAATMGREHAIANLISIAPEGDRDTVTRVITDLMKVATPRPLRLGGRA